LHGCSPVLLSDLHGRCIAMATNQPRLMITMLTLPQRTPEVFQGINGGEPPQVLLEGAENTCGTPVPLRFSHQGGRTGEPQQPQLVLEHL
jgi:hypothetical protein